MFTKGGLKKLITNWRNIMKDINQNENKMEITKSEYIKLKVSDAKLKKPLISALADAGII
ncbi:hypothetical protein BSPWISOXPB_4378 [uncultured Gammaproteobacteria bacterium]|nr:hypothetical protein BSPWISOXPB_4378 [uncultured Gammaproteobacteria bacterium]